MNNKSTLILLICSTQLAGITTDLKPSIRKKPSIDNFFGAPCTFPGPVSEDIEKKIAPNILDQKEWWYLENIIPCQGLIHDIGYNSIGTKIIAKSDRLRIFDATTLERQASFPLDKKVEFTTKTRTEGTIITTDMSNPTIMRIVDTKTNEVRAAFCHQDNTYCASYNPAKNQLATGSFDKCLRIFTRHDQHTLDQIALKKLMSTWLMIQKPDKSITSVEGLFTNIASLLTLDYTELLMVWSTFSENMQIAIFQTMLHKINLYGKKVIRYKKTSTLKRFIPKRIRRA